MKTNNTNSALVAAAFGVFVALVLPLQTFLGNRGEYGFTLMTLVGQQLVLALAIFAVGWVLLALSDRYLRGWLTPVFVAALAVGYLESGPFSFGLPEISGDIPAVYSDRLRGVLDLAALVAVALGIIATFRWSRPWIHLVALGILVLGAASLLDVRPSVASADDVAASDGGYRAISPDIVAAVEYSPTRNILMFVLDSMPADLAAEIVGADPALAAKFPGFVAYRQNIGMHGSTKQGVPGLFLGEYCDETTDIGCLTLDILSPRSFLQAYRDRGNAVFCMIDVLNSGFTTSAAAAAATSARNGTDNKGPVIRRPARGFPYLSLLNVTTYRLMPLLMKKGELYAKLHSRKLLKRVNRHFVNEHVMFPILGDRPLSESPRPMFGKFHSFGAHLPLMFDLDGNPLKTQGLSEMDLRQAVSNTLVHLSRLMDVYRERGLYDQSFIVATTDHGSPVERTLPGLHHQAPAMLWVKPDGAMGALQESDLHTGHVKISALMRAAAAGPLTRTEVDRILPVEVRELRVRDKGTRGFKRYFYE